MSTPFDPDGRSRRNDRPRGKHAPQTLEGIRSLRARLVTNAVFSAAALALIVFTAVFVYAGGADPGVLWAAAGACVLVVVVATVCAQAAFKAANAQLLADDQAFRRQAEERAAEQIDRRAGQLQEFYGLLEKMPGEIAATVGGSVVNSLTQLRKELAAARLVRPSRTDVAPASDPVVQQVVRSIVNQAAEDAERQWKEVVLSLTRRLQPLIRKAIMHVDAVENMVDDGDVLKGLYRIDNGLARTQRRAESILMLLGASIRRSSRPREMFEVLQSAVSGIEHYKRIELPRRVHGELVGNAAQEVILMLAELLENATIFSPPDTKVFVTARPVRDAFVIEIRDSGLSIPDDMLEHLVRLMGADSLKVTDLVQGDGRTGLSVVAIVARRYKIRVKLTTSDTGNRAVVMLPAHLLAAPSRESSPVAEPAASPVAAAPAHAALPGPRGEGGIARPSGPTHSTYSVPGQGSLPQRMSSPALSPPPQTGQAAALSSSGDPAVPDAHGKPMLPRRAGGGQHMAPELRQPRTVPRRATGEAGDYDPGLMGAFQRGQDKALSNDQGQTVTDTSGASTLPHEEIDS
ncbi:ATP-binding protein [Streptomyces phaeochromogenes]|uniref:ATP-binding protein n=1 Tax=Streptomyces phaeochromogenes TaxID=1923 RepID=UPI002E2DEBEB|nr:ATP-binding protein [Streptomyces phaeochromogenes]